MTHPPDPPVPATRADVAAVVFTLINRYGFGVSVAAILLWWILTQLGNTVTATRQELHDHVTVTTFFLRQVCINTARDEGQARNCELAK